MTQIGGPDHRFQSTCWSVVRHAIDPSSPDALQALEELIRSYWKPVYFFVRRRGHKAEPAKDLTQGFFCRLLEKGGLEGYDPERGRFRTYLLGAVRFFLSDQASAEAALKRGGEWNRIELDYSGAEALYAGEMIDDETPEGLYERTWAREVLQQALEEVRVEFQAEGKEIYYRVLKEHLDPTQPSYAEVAARLDLKVTDVGNYLHRARKRLRPAFLRVVLPSVTEPEEVAGELQEIFATLQI